MITLEGNTVLKDGVFRKRIEIGDDGIINKIGSPTGAADFIFGEELIFPGFIDLHVHAREDTSHKEDYKEDFKTAGEAAINGGVTAFVEMPNNPIPPIDVKSYEEKNDLAKNSEVPVLLYAGIGPSTEPLLKKVPYKVFMGKSVGELFFSSAEELESVLKKYEGQQISFHCEDPEVLERHKDETHHEMRRPREAEISGIELALKIIEKYQIRGKIYHVSTKEGAEKIAEAKQRGVMVTAEVTPHHLFFSSATKNLQVNPPIRTMDDCLFLAQALKRGVLDFLATDHAPHTIEEKEKGISGMPYLDTYGLFAAWLIKECGFTPSDVARVCSENPGNFWEFFTGQKSGAVEEGYIGSLTIIDMNHGTTVTRQMLKTKCAWSPFERILFPGQVVATVIKGKMYKK